SKIILLHFYSWVTSLLFDNMFPEFTLFSSLFYRFLIRNWGSFQLTLLGWTIGKSLLLKLKKRV
ncbi:MAG: hypothetical protein ACR5LA_06025, partial [Wolbachia sp.]